MTRLLLSTCAILLLAVTAATADDNIRSVQTKLKQEGFYFGEIDGAFSTDLSAALTRYQIRNGLQITGQLDKGTSKALGADAAVGTAGASPNSETWRRLRKSDRQFQTKVSPERDQSPHGSPRKEAPKSPTAVLVPAESGDATTFLLSPERLRDYVAAFVLAGLDPQVGAELEFFADRVRYYDEGIIDREKIRRGLQLYDARWPQRRFWLAGELQVERQPDSRLRVTFPLRFELRNGSKHSSGKIRKTLLLEVTGQDLEIVAVNESRMR